MKKLLIFALLLGTARVAGAQPDEAPPPENASQSLPHEGETKGGEHEMADPDPSRHFNFLGFSWHGKDEYGGEFGKGFENDPDGNKLEEEPMAPPFVFLLLNFALLLFILAKYLAPAGRKVAEERHDQIKTALDEAAKLRAQAQKKLEDYEARIKGVDSEITKMVADIRASAEADKQRILAAAEAQAKQMKRDADARIAAEIELARAQLTREVAAAAATATATLIRDKATPDDHKKLVSTFISGVGGS